MAGIAVNDSRSGRRILTETTEKQAALVAEKLQAAELAGERFRGQMIQGLGKIQHDVTATRTGLALHIYEAQKAVAEYQRTGSVATATFTSPPGSPLPHGDPEVAARVESDVVRDYLQGDDQ